MHIYDRSTGSELNEAMMKISNDTEKLLSMIRVREEQLFQEEQQVASNSRNITLNARNEASAIIAAANNNASLIEVELTMKKQQMEMELKDWEKEQELIASTVTFDSVIHLNVGGHKFDTTVATMTRFPGSMLGAMFSGRHQLPKDKDGYYFIDQDGTHFRHIINFLRNPEGFVVTLKGEELAELKSQAAYYLLDDVMPMITKLPPQSLHMYSHGSPTNVYMTVVQDENGIWSVRGDANSLNPNNRRVRQNTSVFGIRHQKDTSVILKVCSCRKAYFMSINEQFNNDPFYGLSNNDSNTYFTNFSLPLVAEQPMQSTCQYHNHNN